MEDVFATPGEDPGECADAMPQTPGQGDGELLAACRRGEEWAWTALVNRYERLVFSVALRNGLSRTDAADVTQTTFLALLDSVHRILDDAKLASWLMTVARRQAWRLRERRTREAPLAEIELEGPDLLDRWDQRESVVSALGKLPQSCQELIVALYFDPTQPSYAEIAERMGRAIGGLGPLRGRCLERLRVLMSEEDE